MPLPDSLVRSLGLSPDFKTQTTTSFNKLKTLPFLCLRSASYIGKERDDYQVLKAFKIIHKRTFIIELWIYARLS